MRNDEINRAVAEALGWTAIELSDVWELTDPPEPPRVLCGLRPDGKLRAVPDYAEDLNAIVVAEKAAFASSTQWVDFAFNLLNVLQAAEMSVSDGMTCVLQATAHQRAEAFLRTMGKWRDA